MSERSSDLLRFYEQARIGDQLKFYNERREQFDRATGQALAVSATLLGFAAAVGALAGTTLGRGALWTALAAILPAVSTALAAYIALYAFEQQSKIYGDAVRAIRAAVRAAPGPDGAGSGRSADENAAEFVRRVEAVLRQEHAQWGQLTSQVQIADQTRG